MQWLGSIASILPSPLMVDIVDVGADPAGGEAPYDRLVKSGMARLVGFEPEPKAFAKLEAQKGPNETYLPYALGDGAAHELHVCYASGMSSLFKPNVQLLQYLNGFDDWARVIETITVQTRRLDDVDEIGNVDLLKLDVEGYELEILRHGLSKLAGATIVQIEVNFLPLHAGRPLFGEVDLFLRGQGFLFHKFGPMVSRIIRPMVSPDLYAGMSQLIFADALYVRDFTRFPELSADKLLRLAVILHEAYRSYDLALLALTVYDHKTGTDLRTRYGREILRVAEPAT